MAKIKRTKSTKDHRHPTKVRFDNESARNVLHVNTIDKRNILNNGMSYITHTIDSDSVDNNINLQFSHYKSVGFLIHKDFLTEFATHYEFNDLKNYEERYNIYPKRRDDPFIGEKCFDCIGSGVAITPRHILTPLHVIRASINDDNTLKKFLFVMQCTIDEINSNKITKDNVYDLEKIVLKPNFINKSDINDICILRTVREINLENVVKLNFDDLELIENENYNSLGHPLGLAMKNSYNENQFFGGYYENCFRTFLDAYEKNSGSPVFKHKEVGFVGIVIEAGFGEDFIKDEINSGYMKKAVYNSTEIGIENGTKVLKIGIIIQRISQLITIPEHADPSELDNTLLNLFLNPKLDAMKINAKEGVVRNFEILKKKDSNSKRQFEVNFEIDKNTDLTTLKAELFDIELDENDNESSRVVAKEPISIKNQTISILIDKIKGKPISDLYRFIKAITLSSNGTIVFDAYLISYKINTKPSTQGDIIKIKTP